MTTGSPGCAEGPSREARPAAIMTLMWLGLGWLDAMVGRVRCVSCGALYTRQDLGVVGEREGYVFVRCECRACGREGVAVVLVEAAAARRPHAPAITVEDVLSGHEILRGYTGNVDGLFSTAGRRPR